MADVVKVWRQVENPTPLIDACLDKEHSTSNTDCYISSRSNLNDRTLSIFEDCRPQQQEEEQEQQDE